jgi:hypothetical protein
MPKFVCTNAAKRKDVATYCIPPPKIGLSFTYMDTGRAGMGLVESERREPGEKAPRPFGERGLG